MNINQKKIKTNAYFRSLKTKNMKYLILSFSFLLFILSCQNAETKTSSKTEMPTFEMYGDSNMTLDGSIDIKSLMNLLKDNDSVDVKLKAEVTGVCKKKGCWMDVKLDDSTTMLVRFKDYGFFVPMDCEGKHATIQGQVKKTTHSVEWLRHKAEDAGKSIEEIENINEPEVAYSIDEASAVILQ